LAPPPPHFAQFTGYHSQHRIVAVGTGSLENPENSIEQLYHKKNKEAEGKITMMPAANPSGINIISIIPQICYSMIPISICRHMHRAHIQYSDTLIHTIHAAGFPSSSGRLGQSSVSGLSGAVWKGSR
ncbi:unnamed protein product, partial [Tuber aestivum]